MNNIALRCAVEFYKCWPVHWTRSVQGKILSSTGNGSEKDIAF